MLTDVELWACAQQVTKHHGANASMQVASRIGELVEVGDQEGVDMWKAIAARVDQLLD